VSAAASAVSHGPICDDGAGHAEMEQPLLSSVWSLAIIQTETSPALWQTMPSLHSDVALHVVAQTPSVLLPLE